MMMDLMPRPCRQTIINTKRNTLFREGAYTNYEDMQKEGLEESQNMFFSPTLLTLAKNYSKIDRAF